MRREDSKAAQKKLVEMMKMRARILILHPEYENDLNELRQKEYEIASGYKQVLKNGKVYCWIDNPQGKPTAFSFKIGIDIDDSNVMFGSNGLCDIEEITLNEMTYDIDPPFPDCRIITQKIKITDFDLEKFSEYKKNDPKNVRQVSLQNATGNINSILIQICDKIKPLIITFCNKYAIKRPLTIEWLKNQILKMPECGWVKPTYSKKVNAFKPGKATPLKSMMYDNFRKTFKDLDEIVIFETRGMDLLSENFVDENGYINIKVKIKSGVSLDVINFIIRNQLAECLPKSNSPFTEEQIEALDVWEEWLNLPNNNKFKNFLNQKNSRRKTKKYDALDIMSYREVFGLISCEMRKKFPKYEELDRHYRTKYKKLVTSAKKIKNVTTREKVDERINAQKPSAGSLEMTPLIEIIRNRWLKAFKFFYNSDSGYKLFKNKITKQAFTLLAKCFNKFDKMNFNGFNPKILSFAEQFKPSIALPEQSKAKMTIVDIHARDNKIKTEEKGKKIKKGSKTLPLKSAWTSQYPEEENYFDDFIDEQENNILCIDTEICKKCENKGNNCLTCTRVSEKARKIIKSYLKN